MRKNEDFGYEKSRVVASPSEGNFSLNQQEEDYKSVFQKSLGSATFDVQAPSQAPKDSHRTFNKQDENKID